MSRTLIFQGSDVRLLRRLERGRVQVEYLKRGEPTGLTDDAWPHELRGHPDGLPGIRRMIAALPEAGDGATAAAQPEQQQEARPRGFLFAHHAADHEREE